MFSFLSELYDYKEAKKKEAGAVSLWKEDLDVKKFCFESQLGYWLAWTADISFVLLEPRPHFLICKLI